METTLEFPVLLGLIEERSAAFRAAAGAAPDLRAPVPTCPEWTLLDLVRHLGLGQRRLLDVVGHLAIAADRGRRHPAPGAGSHGAHL